MLWGELGAIEIPDSLSVLGLETTMASFTAMSIHGPKDTVNPPLRRVKQAEKTLPYTVAGDYLFPQSLTVSCYLAYNPCTNLLFFKLRLFPKNKKGSKLPELPRHSGSLYLFIHYT